MTDGGKYPKLRHPPIVEAMLAISVEGTADAVLSRLEALGNALPDYAVRQPAFSFISVGEQPAGRARGYEFSDQERTRVFHARLDVFAVSFLGPYSTFERLENEAKKLWPLYRDIVGSTRISRIGLRYINRIEIPASHDFSDYLRTVPEVASNLPQGLEDFGMRLVLPDTDTDCSAIISELMDTSSGEDADKAVIFFDIDAFQLVDSFLSDASVWAIVHELRDYKNRIFFESITDRLREAYGVE